MGNSPKFEPYIKVPEDLFDAFCDYVRNDKSMTRTEIMLWLKIMRDTYGYNRTEHMMTDDYLNKALGISLWWVRQTKKKLKDRNLIKVKKDNKGRCVLSLQRDYREWRNDIVSTDSSSCKQYVSTDSSSCRSKCVVSTDTNGGSSYRHHQDIIEEDIIEEKIIDKNFLFFRGEIARRFPDVYEPSDDDTVIRVLFKEKRWHGAIEELLKADTESYQYKNVKEMILDGM